MMSYRYKSAAKATNNIGLYHGENGRLWKRNHRKSDDLKDGFMETRAVSKEIIII